MSDSLAAGNQLLGDVEDVVGHDVLIHDDSLRDGEQTVGVSFSSEQKVEIARRLVDAGIDSLNLGFPVVSAEEAEVVKTIVSTLKGTAVDLSCMARAIKEDVAAVERCGVPTIAMFLGISDPHLDDKHRMTEDQAEVRIREQIGMARASGLKVRFALEDSSRAPWPRLQRLTAAALEAGASKVVFCDTCGILTPRTTERVVQRLVALAGPGVIAIHFHDDLGMATANALTAAAAGAAMVQGTMVGIGERAGNTRIEEFVVAARVKYGLFPRVDILKMIDAAAYVRGLVKFAESPNTPITGANVFAHESGIHVHGLRRDPSTYEPFPPALIGRVHEYRYGKHAGASNIEYVAERLGLTPAREVVLAVLDEVKRLALVGATIDEAHVASLLRMAARSVSSTT